MMKTTVGQVTFAVGLESLVIEDPNYPEHPVLIPIEHLSDLINFLHGIVQQDRRAARRLSVDTEAGLEVSISDGSVVYVAQPDDISLIGLSASVDGVYVFDVGCAVTVDMKFKGRTTTLQGVVQRHEQSKLGIEFSRAYLERSSAAAEELKTIVSTLDIRRIRRGSTAEASAVSS